ncbi:hypothetical protein MM300_16510 [Evansella sp. LMS18]|uniref:hypothetical protein n=1 Tax=Evansella sp. LMS18 TaxID=2924033 RepID=UPI0020D00EE8|nr:hypothetical protein [Evansella sp. LMS18]UTR09485.1 hypothetical protein MM300_16510 [Evansella sp. LMS18]
MELLIIPLVILALIHFFSRLFVRKGWTVNNYTGLKTPYSIGTVLFAVVTLDALFYRMFPVGPWEYYYLSFVWILGLIDDRFGKPQPKGIRGHFRLFLEKKEVSTGLIKAVGVAAAATIYMLFSFEGGMYFGLAALMLLILFPHSMNLFDTKPLRVWKILSLLIFWPVFTNAGLITAACLALVIIMLGSAESRIQGMLGDNGAMLAGALGAILLLHYAGSLYILAVTVFTVIVTFLAERISLQAWVEATPGIKLLDQFGRLK